MFGLSNNKEVCKDKDLGVRISEETKILATYNLSMYSLVVLYKDSSREIIECNAKEFREII